MLLGTATFDFSEYPTILSFILFNTIAFILFLFCFLHLVHSLIVNCPMRVVYALTAHTKSKLAKFIFSSLRVGAPPPSHSLEAWERENTKHIVRD